MIALVAARTISFWAVAVLLGGAGLATITHRRGRTIALALKTAALLAAIGGATWFALVFIEVTGEPGALLDADAWSAFLSAPFVWPWLLRLGLCAVALVLSVAGRAPIAFLMIGLCLALDQAWLGHAANGDTMTQIGFYWLHVVCGFAWTGALIMLCLLTFEEGEVPTDALAVFSSLGLFVVAAILASGLVNAGLRGVGVVDLATTSYGRLVVAKAFLFATMLVFAAVNRGLRHRTAAEGHLRRSILAETGFGLSILGIAAMLGVTAPP